MAEPVAMRNGWISQECDAGSHRLSGIDIPFRELRVILGPPLMNDDGTYVNDEYKTDVQWELLTPTQGKVVIWNYKNGPNYGEANSINEIEHFSVWYTRPEDFRQLCSWIAGLEGETSLFDRLQALTDDVE